MKMNSQELSCAESSSSDELDDSIIRVGQSLNETIQQNAAIMDDVFNSTSKNDAESIIENVIESGNTIEDTKEETEQEIPDAISFNTLQCILDQHILHDADPDPQVMPRSSFPNNFTVQYHTISERRASPAKKKRSRKRCLNVHPQNPNVEKQHGSGNRSLCTAFEQTTSFLSSEGF
jgi:hypothetical protein